MVAGLVNIQYLWSNKSLLLSSALPSTASFISLHSLCSSSLLSYSHSGHTLHCSANLFSFHCLLDCVLWDFPFPHMSAHFYRTQVSLGSDLWVRFSLAKRRLWNLTDVTLADEDTNSILTDNANRVIPGNVAMHVTQPGGQLWKQCKWRHLMTKF